MRKDYLFTLLNKDVTLRGLTEYQRHLVRMDRDKMKTNITHYDVCRSIELAKANIKRLCIPFTHIPKNIFSKLDRYIIKGYKNNMRMFELYLNNMEGCNTIKDIHINISKNLKDKDLYNHIYKDQLFVLSEIRDMLKSIRENKKKSEVK